MKRMTLMAAGAIALLTLPLIAQEGHDHPMTVHGVPGGVPFFCANPTVTSVASGAWSSPATWSTRKVPGLNDKVRIGAAHDIVYDASSDRRVSCLEVAGRLSFKTDVNTRLKVINLMVVEGGSLEVGTVARPVAAGVTAEIVIADQAPDPAVDPAQLGTGVEGLGRIRMHGAVKTPTFARLALEPLAGQTTLTFEQPVTSWKAGDHIVIPDTRQLREGERGVSFLSQDESLTVAGVSGSQITLAVPLRHDHKGARTPDGTLEFLPHVGNLSRNVIVRSENPSGVRGHMIFMARADVDMRYVEVREMGRTRMGVLSSAEFDAAGRVTRFPTNQIGRYAIHFHHDCGPAETPANGYQFTLIGNSVDSAPKWGITVHDSHYGLIQDNVVYNTRGAGIVAEDGTESFNVFDHNFAMRSEGSGDFAPRSGYGGAAPDPGGEGAGFWFRGPNNYIRNNVAANGDVFGFGLAAGALGTIRIPKFKGADITKDAETVPVDTTNASVPEFANNEAYGAIQTGAAWGWNGTISNFRVWHTSRHGVTAMPTDKLVIDNVTVRGDVSVLASELESPAGVWLSNYMSKSIVVRNANVQGMRVGVASPFFTTDQTPEPGRGDGSAIIENGYFKDYIGIVVATSYVKNSKGDAPLKNAIVRNSTFEPLPNVRVFPNNPPVAISMNYRMAPGDADPRDPISVYDFNKRAGENFRVYYSLEAPQSVAPCHDTRTDIGGWVCK
ncbi:MAG: G8 domain-containing protein [Vicinamibacterales bacterium]